MLAVDLLALVEGAAKAVAFFRGKPPQRVYINPDVLQSVSRTGLWDLPQVQQAQVGGSFRILRKLRLDVGVVEVMEDRDELLFRFE